MCMTVHHVTLTQLYKSACVSVRTDCVSVRIDCVRVRFDCVRVRIDCIRVRCMTMTTLAALHDVLPVNKGQFRRLQQNAPHLNNKLRQALTLY